MGQYLGEIVGEGPSAAFLGFWSVMGKYITADHCQLTPWDR